MSKFFLYLLLSALSLVGTQWECQGSTITCVNIYRFYYNGLNNSITNKIIERHYASIYLSKLIRSRLYGNAERKVLNSKFKFKFKEYKHIIISLGDFIVKLVSLISTIFNSRSRSSLTNIVEIVSPSSLICCLVFLVSVFTTSTDR